MLIVGWMLAGLVLGVFLMFLSECMIIKILAPKMKTQAPAVVWEVTHRVALWVYAIMLVFFGTALLCVLLVVL